MSVAEAAEKRGSRLIAECRENGDGATKLPCSSGVEGWTISLQGDCRAAVFVWSKAIPGSGKTTLALQFLLEG